MANNIYIGNRYVPVFANPVEWDNLREYEALTIVTYNGTAYTSRQRVPVGTALSNTEYWVVTGNYNAQVEQYRQEVNQLASDLDTLSDSVDSRIDSVNERISVLDVGSVVCIGDSYLDGYTPSGNIQSWGDRLCTMLGKTMNTDFFKFSHGGTGFNATADNYDFSALLTQAHNTVTDANSVGTIIVLGGANESATGLADKIVAFMNSAKSYFPNANVYYAYGSEFISTPPYDASTIYSVYANTVSKGTYIGNLVEFLKVDVDRYYNGDKRHPSSDGQNILAYQLYKLLDGGCIGSPTENTVQIGNNFITYIEKGILNIQLYAVLFKDFASGETVTNHTSNAYNLLFSVPCNTGIAKTDNNFYRAHTGGLIKGGGIYYPADFIVRFYPDRIEFYDMAINSAGSNYVTSDVTNAQVLPFKIEFPLSVV